MSKNDFKNRPVVPEDSRLYKEFTEATLATLFSPEHDSPDWHELRSSGIGSSDAPIILGLSRFSTPVELWNYKRGIEIKNFIHPAYAWFGNFFESYIREQISEQEGIEIVDGGNLGQLSWLFWSTARANIDAFSTTDGVIEEIKTSGKKWTSLPLDYYAQVQHQLMVTGAKKARVRQFYCPVERRFIYDFFMDLKRKEILCDEDVDKVKNVFFDGLFKAGELVTWPVERDEAFIEQLYEREKLFWGYVESGEEPVAFLEKEEEVEITDDADMLKLCKDFVKVKEELNKKALPLTKREKLLKEEMKGKLESYLALSGVESKKVLCGGVTATYIQSKSSESGGYWKFSA